MASRDRAASTARARRRAAEIRDTRGLQIEHVPIDRLRPWPGNPRIMSEPEMAKLIRSIDEFGLVEPLVVRRQDDTVIGGHQRLAAVRARGIGSHHP